MTAIDKLKELVSDIEQEAKLSNSTGQIGVGITTHNRSEMFKKSYNEIVRHLPDGAVLVVVDDASKTPVEIADYRFDENVGIARAKNKALELLYLQGCEHFFLFDDDTYPLVKGWEKKYIECSEPHLNYIFTDFETGRKLNDTIEIYRDDEKVAYSHARGCMLYYHRSVLDAVGGMDPVFGKWGYEHPSFSDRIYNAGLTTFRYMDVADSKGLFYSDDEQNENVNTTVIGNERQKMVARNTELYRERKYSKEYIPFIEKKNILITSYFTNVGDPQRNGQKWDFEPKKIYPLLKSLKKTKLVVLYDYEGEMDDIKDGGIDIEFIRVPTSINPYFQRWVSYREYLHRNRHTIANVFCIDATDVEVLQEPDWENLGDFLYTGDEPNTLDDAGGWMRKNHKHPLIQSMLDEKGKQWQMLNAGIVGGSVETVISFIRDLVDFYAISVSDSHFHNKPDAGIGDMGAFNYIARTNYGDRLRHGSQINTRFKANERNSFSWFKHK